MIVEIYALSPNGESRRLAEKWELVDGIAYPLAITDKKEGPLYPSLGGVPPQNGKAYLERLVSVVENSSYLDAVVSTDRDAM